MGKWRAGVLIGIHVLIGLHVLHWRLAGRTVSPVEPSESMYALEQGYINAGLILFALAMLATLIFGRYFCGWACHVVALQDLCGWMMKKIGVRPKPFRARLLLYFPLTLALYMFVWPSFERLALIPMLQSLEWERAVRFFGGATQFPGFSNHLVTEDFWATFPSIWVAIPFFLICGFATVYFLGAKGYCTYACPYGGFFAPLDKLALGRIVVDPDKCHQCGHCTAACTSNVRVHEEIREFGMVVDPGCMKCMDCVSVCPNDALSFKFAKPAILKGKPKTQTPKRKFDLTWPEEIALVVVLLLTFFAWRSMYGVIPMLMAAGIAGVGAFLFWKLWRVYRDRDVRIIGAQLKRAGRIKPAGVVFAALTSLALLATAHSLFVRYHWWRGDLIDTEILVARNDALSQAPGVIPEVMLDRARRAIHHYTVASSFRRGGLALADSPTVQARLAWAQLVAGELDDAAATLARLDKRYGYADLRAADRATILAVSGREMEAVAYLEDAVAELHNAPVSRDLLVSAHLAQRDLDNALRVRRDAIDPSDPNARRVASARAKLAALLLQFNRAPEALTELQQAAALAPDDASIRNDHAVALYFTGQTDQAIEEMRIAVSLDADDAMAHVRLGKMLESAGRAAEAAASYETARRLNPSLFQEP